MIWLATRDNTLSGTNMCVVTGAHIELAIGIISRIKRLFEPHGIFFDSKQTNVTINNCTITASPRTNWTQ